MCGIIAYMGAREAAPILVAGLRRLEYRGYDSAGIAVLDERRPGGIQRVRAAGKIAALADKLGVEEPTGRAGIGHTRWATHGRPCERNAHPHRGGSVCVVHNGIIENHAELRARLEGEGRRLTSDTDTEVIAHLVDRHYDRLRAAARAQAGGDSARLVAAVQASLAELRGAYALALIHDDHPGSIVGARSASPLIVGVGEGGEAAELFLASDVAAILEHTRTVLDLEDGDVVHLDADAGLAIHDSAGQRVERPRRRVEWSPVAVEKQGFSHFMAKEIFEQPQAIRATTSGRLPRVGEDDLGRGEPSFPELAELDVPALAARAKVTMLACGTSWHAALAGKYLFEQLARVPVEVDLASEFRYRQPIVRPGDLAVAISQSGETADTRAALMEARRLGATGLAICNVVDSSIAREADRVLYTHAGPEISVASTKAFTTQLAMLTLLAVHFGRRTGALTLERAAGLLDGLRELPVALDAVLGQAAAIEIIARRWRSARDWLYLGRGLAFPVALEGALKLKEISYVHAEGYACGEIKHGPIALVDERVPVVVLALEGPGYHKTLASLEEVRARGGKIIALASAGDRRIGDLADDVILVPRVDPYLQPILASVPLQLLAYHLARLEGRDVDQPRNLAKSVTVE